MPPSQQVFSEHDLQKTCVAVTSDIPVISIKPTLCEDLLMGMRDRRLLTDHIDDATLAALLDEVTDAVLRQKVLYFADAAATADQHVASAEAWVMEAALKRWHLE